MDPKAKVVEVVARKLPVNRLGLPDGIFRADLLPLPQFLAAVGVASSPSVPSAGAPEEEKPAEVELQTLVKEDASDPQDVEVADVSTPSGSETENGNGNTQVPITGEMLGEIERRHEMLVTAALSADVLQAAYVPLNYHEGFPAFADGKPLWKRMEWEPHECHELFLLYVKMGRKGARQLFRLAEAQDTYDLQEVKDWSIIYFWSARARAYDLFHAAHQRKREAHSVSRILNKHKRASASLWTRLQTYLEGGEFWETITPQTATNLLKLVVMMERMSVGLPANGPSPNTSAVTDAATAGTASVELLMRQLVEQQAATLEGGGAGQGDQGLLIDEEGKVVDELTQDILSDPSKVMEAQETIIRLTQRRVKMTMLEMPPSVRGVA